MGVDCGTRIHQLWGGVGVIISALILVFGFISLHDADVPDPADMILPKPNETGKNVVTGIAVLLILQVVSYAIDGWWVTPGENAMKRSKTRIGAIFSSTFQTMCTVYVIVTTVVTVLLWVQKESTGMVMVHDLVLITIALQALAMYINWSLLSASAYASPFAHADVRGASDDGSTAQGEVQGR